MNGCEGIEIECDTTNRRYCDRIGHCYFKKTSVCGNAWGEEAGRRSVGCAVADAGVADAGVIEGRGRVSCNCDVKGCLAVRKKLGEERLPM